MTWKMGPFTLGKNVLARHVACAVLAGALTFVFWETRPQWSADMRLWRAFGDAAFMMLIVTMALGPLSRVWPKARPALRWRRPFGVWFALTALVHAYLVWDGWARWSIRGFLGYEELPIQEGVTEWVLTQPGFGFSNLVGLTALIFAVLLLATSSDWALSQLGGKAWRQLHRASNIVFWLVALHSGYFLFLHYELNLRMLVLTGGMPPDPNWFRFPFLVLVLTVVILKAIAYAMKVHEYRSKREGS